MVNLGTVSIQLEIGSLKNHLSLPYRGYLVMACRNQRQICQATIFPMNGFPGEERSVEVTARVAVAAGSPVVRTRSGG